MSRPYRILPFLAVFACAGAPRPDPVPAAGGAPVAETSPGTPDPATLEPSPPAPDLVGSPPALPGFTVDGEPTTYDATTLFEYINGAADGFLKFGFEELVAIDYARADSGAPGAITVDVYRHANAYNGFGIYRQEQFADGRELELGAGATYKPGVLVFFKDRFYVKLTGSGLGDDDEATLASAARAVSDLLPGTTGLPRLLTCFPPGGLVAGSPRYINEAFLGHGFLSSVFVADYELDGQPGRMFLIEAANEASARGILERYVGLARDKGQAIEQLDGRTRFRDPYLHSAAPITLMVRGRYLLGIFAQEAGVADRHLDEATAALRARSLLD